MKTSADHQLVQSALDACRNAYAPYSRFRVGAALSVADGTIVTGANVENCSYGLSICAERVALFKAVTGGMQRFEAIAVATLGGGFASPCGACRQVMWEFASADARVILANGRGRTRVMALRDLLPEPFGMDSLIQEGKA